MDLVMLSLKEPLKGNGYHSYESLPFHFASLLSRVIS